MNFIKQNWYHAIWLTLIAGLLYIKSSFFLQQTGVDCADALNRNNKIFLAQIEEDLEMHQFMVYRNPKYYEYFKAHQEIKEIADDFLKKIDAAKTLEDVIVLNEVYQRQQDSCCLYRTIYRPDYTVIKEQLDIPLNLNGQDLETSKALLKNNILIESMRLANYFLDKVSWCKGSPYDNILAFHIRPEQRHFIDSIAANSNISLEIKPLK